MSNISVPSPWSLYILDPMSNPVVRLPWEPPAPELSLVSGSYWNNYLQLSETLVPPRSILLTPQQLMYESC